MQRTSLVYNFMIGGAHPPLSLRTFLQSVLVPHSISSLPGQLIFPQHDPLRRLMSPRPIRNEMPVGVFCLVLLWGSAIPFMARGDDALQRDATTSGVLLIADRGGLPQVVATELSNAGQRIIQRLLDRDQQATNYRYELGLEAALEFAAATGDDRLQRRVIAKAASLGITPETQISWRRQPFGCLTHALYRTTEDQAWLSCFVKETHSMKRDVWRNEDGVILHPRGQSRGGGHAMLIDAMQEYAARLARASAITGDRDLLAEAATQWRCYADVLRSRKTGLWRQGKGWLIEQPDALSPGAWSRGHGWLLRGLTATLEVAPPDADETRFLHTLFGDLCKSLLPLQQPDGTWHTLLHRDPQESPPDVSGTAMIATAFSIGWRRGWLSDQRFREAAQKAFAWIPTNVTDAAEVNGVSPGPGPLQSEAEYLVQEFPADNDHGLFAVLFAAAEQQRLLREVESRK